MLKDMVTTEVGTVVVTELCYQTQVWNYQRERAKTVVSFRCGQSHNEEKAKVVKETGLG